MKRSLLLVLICTASMSAAFAQKTVVIANRSTHAEQMTAADIRDIFTGATTRFSNGTPAVPVFLRAGPEHDSFLKDYVGKLDSSFRIGWRSLVFTGQANMPKSVEDDAAMLNYVASNPGAVGYVSKVSARDNVIIVTVR
jgi:ABC-type phosphate transport system substrate-binding protein